MSSRLGIAAYDASSDEHPHWPDSGAWAASTVFVPGSPRPPIWALPGSLVLARELRTGRDPRWVIVEGPAGAAPGPEGVLDIEDGLVLFHGKPRDAINFLLARGVDPPITTPVTIGCDGRVTEVGPREVGVGGFWASLRGSDESWLIAGVEAVAGRSGVAIAWDKAGVGDHGVAVATGYGSSSAEGGDYSIAIGDGPGGKARVGAHGVAITRDAPATAIAGDTGVAVGVGGCASVGDEGVAILWAGEDGGETRGMGGERSLVVVDYDEGVASAGRGSVLVFARRGWDRVELLVAHIDGKEFVPGVAYQVRDGVVVPAAEDEE